MGSVMVHNSINRYKKWYRRFLCLYPEPFRKRFSNGMEQTFNDLCRERLESNKGILSFAIWIFIETLISIIKENKMHLFEQHKVMIKRLSVWSIVIAFILLIPLALTITGSGVDGDGFHWTPIDFVIAGILLLGTGLIFDIVIRMIKNIKHRIVTSVVLLIVLLLVWAEIAVGFLEVVLEWF